MSDVADRIAVQDVMLRYAAGVDERDANLYRSCFADDVAVFGMGSAPVRGIDAWMAFWTKALERYGPTQHMLGPTLATVRGDEASTRTDVQATHVLKDAPDTIFTLWATYKTDMRRVDGAWKIVRHELVPRATRTLK
jgi:ketosteroid isomerase-like protein